jgi:ATP-binding cassette, subfamily C, bacterial LapB
VLIIGAGWALQKRLHALSLTTHLASAERNATLVESLTGLETLKAMGAEGRTQARWERTHAHLSTTQVQMRRLSSRATQGTQLITQVANVAMVLIGVFLIHDRTLTMGALVACTMLGSRALAPAGMVVGLLLQYQGARTALESLNAVMARAQEREPDKVPLQRPQLQGAIELRGVSFQYPGQQDKVLNDLSLRIEAGERVAFIGRVGSGKSSLLRLVMGLYQPSSGAVLVDGIDIRQLDPADLRRAQALVAQDVQLFHGTLRDNITLGLPLASDDAVLRAAELACLNEFVQRHPQGFDLPVGERGERLSGGQRQAVGLARAALLNAPMLLLDEPTSAMDFSTETQLTRRMGEFAQGKTLLLVTHRSAMLALVDRVIVLDGGRIVADGPREHIMQALAAGRIGRAA